MSSSSDVTVGTTLGCGPFIVPSSVSFIGFFAYEPMLNNTAAIGINTFFIFVLILKFVACKFRK